MWENAESCVALLTGLTYKLGTTPLGTLAYAYDANGNRTVLGGSWARTGLPAALGSATYNAANHQLTFGSTTLTYDLNGNLTSDGTNTYTWDARNRLVAISGGNAASFQYDGQGRRASKTINSAQTGFLYDGLNPVQELNGSTVAANLLTGLGIDEYLTRTEASGSSYFLSDALGSLVALSDATGALPTSYTYTPFGATSLSGSATGNAFDYTGREDDGTGLKYYRARYYHPQFQRFISADPIALSGGDVNFYAYVMNNPIRNLDHLGLKLDLRYAGSLEEPLKRVRRTKRGFQIFDQLERSPNTYTIRETRGREVSHFDKDKLEIVVNTQNPPLQCMTSGRKPATPEGDLAHEGGHALGFPDAGPDKMVNINANENPVLRELGMAERLSYDLSKCPP